jgi:hypothetical protein
MARGQEAVWAACGIRVDGRDVGISLESVCDAESAAAKLCAHGFGRIEIFDRASGRILRYVAPSPANA